ncbi:MAG: hypothetical protein ABI400_08790 [Lacisediminihabitans sp.]
MTEPQVWVLIGVFAAAFFALIGIVTTNFNRTMDARFDAVRADLDAKFDVTNVKLENMVRDIQAISRQVFGADPR